MSTYDYLKTESTEERVPKDADISVAENLRLLKASDDWIETIFTDGEVVVFSLDEMPIWKNEGFDIRSAV